MSASLLKELTHPFDCPDIRRLDIHALRSAFAALMDAAADAAHAAGLELDDCLLERRADICLAPGEGPHTVEVDLLSDRELCIRSILARVPPAESRRVGIVALRVRLIRGGMLDPFGFMAAPA